MTLPTLSYKGMSVAHRRTVMVSRRQGGNCCFAGGMVLRDSVSMARFSSQWNSYILFAVCGFCLPSSANNPHPEV